VGGAGKNIMIDHVSASWSSDEVMSIYKGTNVTIQYCLISEAAGGGHRFGGIWGNIYGTYHHNCFAHNDNRTPRWAGKKNEWNDYRNNVVYNTGYGGCYGGLPGDKINMIANYYKPGPATADPSRIASPDGGDWHISKNVVVGADDVTADNWKGMRRNKYTRKDEPWPAMPIKEETAEEAYETFLAHGGCSFPNRDALDKRIVEEIRNGTANHGKKGMITRPADAGSWPELKSTEPPPDKDHDGMPDAWESRNGLNPDDASDGSQPGKDGYTNLENYLNGLVSGIAAPTHVKKSLLKFNSLNGHLLSARQNLFYSGAPNSQVRLEIFGIAGSSAAILTGCANDAGAINFDVGGLNLSPGMYVYKFTGAN
jgi:pectate lyase